MNIVVLVKHKSLVLLSGYAADYFCYAAEPLITLPPIKFYCVRACGISNLKQTHDRIRSAAIYFQINFNIGSINDGSTMTNIIPS